jgi:hypothetical protein
MTRKILVALNKENHLFCIFATALIVSMLLISCKQPVNEQPVNKSDNNVDPDVFVVDISQNTDWNYMVVGTDGSSLLFTVDETTGIPTLMYLKPDKDSDAGVTYLFKENGLPDKMIANGHIVYFGNFNGYQFDMAVIYPNDTIEYHYDIETDINWDVYDESPSGQARSIFGDIWGIASTFLHHTLGSVSCGMAVVSLGTNVFADLGCGTYVVGLIGDAIVVDGGESANTLGSIYSAIGCVTGLDAMGCVSTFVDLIDLGVKIDLDFATQRNPELAQANGVINGGRGDVKVTLSWNNLADVDLHVVDPYGEEIYYSHKSSASGGALDIDNTYGYGPENIFWPAGGAPTGTYKVYVNFYGIGTSGASNRSSDFTVLITAFRNSKTYTGTVTSNSGKVLVATFNSNGVIAQYQGPRVIIDMFDSSSDEGITMVH